MNKLSRRHFGLCAALAVAAAALPAGAQPSAAAGRKNKVIFQVSDNDPAKWGLALNNAHNVQSALGADAVDVEIVAYGPGIGMLQADSPVAPRIKTALASGTKIVACENAMKGHKLAPSDMLPDIGYVPSGVVELMQKEQQGYAYIRP
ncbi:MAG TPA: DsrE family protein [Burkholderiaceae bacterium]|nr:DsrE family protein [Burkholderiaceae bacterium]